MCIEKDIANKLRKALETVYDKTGFKKYPFNKFPDNCCEHTCDLLGYLLAKQNIHTVKIRGELDCNTLQAHYWLLTDGGKIIDITEDQFANKLVSESDVKKVRFGVEGKVQKLFYKNRTKEPIVSFTNKNEFTNFNNTPSAYQQRLIEVYNIIKEFL